MSRKGYCGSQSTQSPAIDVLVQQDLNRLQKPKIDSLRKAIIKGEESGVPEDFEMDTFIAAKRKAR